MKLSRRQFEAACLAGALGPAALAQETRPPKEVIWLTEVQTPPARLPAETPQLPPILFDAERRPITTLDGWNKERQALRDNWVLFLGLWDKSRRPPEFEILDSQRVRGVVRRHIVYETERDLKTEAYLLMPRFVQKRLPAVVVLHSTVDYTIRQGAGLEGPPEAAWGLALAERGFVTICPRCFLWDKSIPPNYQVRVAEHQARHPNARGMAKMLFDAQRAVDVLASQPEVDPARIGAAGHSLGAKEALYLAAFDERIRVTVASEGGIGIGFSNWEAPWYLGTRQFGHDHHELLAMIAPRPFLIIGGESADGARSWPYVAAALEVGKLYNQPFRLGLFNHRLGHKIPPQAESRVYEWFTTYL